MNPQKGIIGLFGRSYGDSDGSPTKLTYTIDAQLSALGIVTAHDKYIWEPRLDRGPLCSKS